MTGGAGCSWCNVAGQCVDCEGEGCLSCTGSGHCAMCASPKWAGRAQRIALLSALEEAERRGAALVFLRQLVGSIFSDDVREVHCAYYVARRDDAPLPARICGLYFPAESVPDAIGENWGPWAEPEVTT